MDDDHKWLPFDVSFVEGAVALPENLSELIRWAKTFHDLGLAPSYGEGSHGNVSMRTSQGCLISATKTFLAELVPEDFVVIVGCDAHAKKPHVQVVGSKQPSTDSMIHWSLYQWRPDVQCILHAHDPRILEAADRLGLPQTAEAAQAGSANLVSQIETLKQEDYFLVREHGFVAMGESIQAAGDRSLAVLDQVAS